MAIITIPAAVAARIGGQSFGQARYDVRDLSQANGASFTRLLGPPRWRTSLRAPAWLSPSDAGAWEAMLLQLRGSVNHLAVYDFTRQAPLGTLRGTPRSAQADAGATSVVLRNAVGTLLAGDWLMFGSGLTGQLVKITAGATSTVTAAATGNWTTTTPAAATWTTTGAQTATWSTSGQLTAQFEPPLRAQIASNGSVTWDKPVAHYKLVNESLSWDALPGGVAFSGFAVDLLEDWS